MVFGNRDKNRSSTTYNPDTGMAHTTRSVKGRKSRPSINFLLASLLTVAGAVLLWLCAFSAVYINSIYYIIMNDRVGDRLGTFGYCVTRGEVFGCSASRVGYTYPLIPNSNGLTGALILTPIAAGLASLAFFALLFSIIRRRGGFLPFILTLIAALIALVSFILALVAFVTFHRRAGDFNLEPEYGPALWLHLAGTAALLLAIPFTLLGWIRQRKASRSTESTLYPVATPVHDTTYVEPATGPTTYRPVSPVVTPVVAPLINRSPTQPRTVVPIVREDTYLDSTPVSTQVYPTATSPSAYPTTNSYNNGNAYNNNNAYATTPRNDSYNNGGAYATNEPSRSYSPASSPVGGRRNVSLASPLNPLATHVDVTHPSYAQNPTYRS